MHTIHIIDKLDSTHEGPKAIETDEHVFLNQGSLDGACGHYCVFMSLIINGVLKKSEAVEALGYKQDGRTHIGKLAARIKDHRFFEGTLDSDIENIFDGIYGNQIEVDRFSKHGNLREFVVSNIKQNNPVMLGISFQGGGHWVLVVGLDYAGDDEDKELCRFLVIDPGGSNMEFCSWNGVIEAKGAGGPYPYEWWGENRKVKLKDAIAIKAI